MRKNITPSVTIVIPKRMEDDVDETLWSLQDQSFKNFKIIIVPDQDNGANWARNEGWCMVDTEYTLFSDNDIKWSERALEWLVQALEENPEASYAYGVWGDERGELSFEEYDEEELKKRNYISTMSLVRTGEFCGWDEDIERLQDWDCWLTMMKMGKVGVNCGQRIFSTVTSSTGITNESSEDYQKAKKIIINKHNL